MNNDNTTTARSRNRNVREAKTAVQPHSPRKNPLRRPPPVRFQRRAFTARDGRRIVPFFEADTVLRGRFRITEMIGSGGFGQIYRAIDKVRICFYSI
jgi:serine/threonine protein kinase